MLAISFRLRTHNDYQRVYKAGRKQFSKQIAFFFSLRPLAGPDGSPLRVMDATAPRVGLTVGKVLGKAVDRNRIKRRLRAAVRRQLPLLHVPVDVILHPRRTVLDMEYLLLEREVAQIFRTIQKAAERQQASAPAAVAAEPEASTGRSS